MCRRTCVCARDTRTYDTRALFYGGSRVSACMCIARASFSLFPQPTNHLLTHTHPSIHPPTTVSSTPCLFPQPPNHLHTHITQPTTTGPGGILRRAPGQSLPRIRGGPRWVVGYVCVYVCVSVSFCRRLPGTWAGSTDGLAVSMRMHWCITSNTKRQTPSLTYHSINPHNPTLNSRGAGLLGQWPGHADQLQGGQEPPGVQVPPLPQLSHRSVALLVDGCDCPRATRWGIDSLTSRRTCLRTYQTQASRP